MDNKPEDFKTEAVEYIGLLEQLGIKDEDTSSHKIRAHRRFNFDSPDKTILLQIGDDMCALSDVSVGGLSFYSRNEYKSGTKIGLNFDGRYQVEVMIVSSFVQNAESNDGETIIRHGAEFVRKGDGYKCTIAVLNYFLEIDEIKF